MLQSWSAFFGFGEKPTESTITYDSAPLPDEQETSSPLCCKALAQSALQQSSTCWPHVPKYQNRVKDFLTWIDTNASHAPGEEDGDDEWVEIASTTDLNKADFAFTIQPDHSSSKIREEKFFIPLSNHSFTQINASTSITTFNPSAYLGTGNSIHIDCPACNEGFKIGFLVRKGRRVDIQLVDILNAGTRGKVEEMMVVFPGWRVDRLKSVLYRKRGVVKEAIGAIERGEERGGG
ncbi:hypothetical protein E6O75_ATG01317 [Venturia nashicola]|uniref:Uncharacterized protein n=1 Tax=Venturia nashicola TaxID=86259 RepID=A0A4Z1PGM2_9PEZI|nr:hypothetical protein E6O75_ATG01317 [Venturia nashicola]